MSFEDNQKQIKENIINFIEIFTLKSFGYLNNFWVYQKNHLKK